MTRVSARDTRYDRCHLQLHDNVHFEISFDVFNQLHNVLVLTAAENFNFTCQGLAIGLRGDLFVDNLHQIRSELLIEHWRYLNCHGRVRVICSAATHL